MLDRDLVSEVLLAARRRGGDVAEVFVEERSSTAIRLDDGRVEELTTGLDRGAGVRVFQGTTYGYAYANRLDRDSLLEAAAAASGARSSISPSASGPARTTPSARRARSTPRPRSAGSAPSTRLRAR